jgi:SAM-dependent methyltransferase
VESNPFSSVWKEVLREKGGINEMVQSHLKEREPFLVIIEKYIKQLQAEEKINVLEVGCGTAIDSYCIAKNPKVECWALDISPEAIELAKEIGRHFKDKINLKVADAMNTGFPDGFFNLIFSQGVMEHFKDPLPVIREQVKILSEGGYIIIDVPQKYNIYTLYRRIFTLLGKWPYGWERSYSLRELRKLGNRAGLKLIEVVGWGVDCELSRSKRAIIAIWGKLYNLLIKKFYRYLHKFSFYFLQNICVVFRIKQDRRECK